MTSPDIGPLQRAADEVRPRAGLVFAAALMFGGAGLIVGPGMPQFLLLGVGLVLGSSALWVLAIAHLRRTVDNTSLSALSTLIEHDNAAAMISGADGVVLCANPAA